MEQVVEIDGALYGEVVVDLRADLYTPRHSDHIVEVLARDRVEDSQAEELAGVAQADHCATGTVSSSSSGIDRRD